MNGALVSVIVPSAGDEARLASLVAALREQIFDAPYEVIVVNDRPQQDRSGLAFCAADCDCRVLAGEGNGPARARNLGAARARGTYLLFLDDDVRIDRRYLARVIRELAARPGHAISGRQMAIRRQNVFSLAAEWMLHRFSEGEASTFAASNALALRRADFEKCGGFDPDFPLAAAEDRAFSFGWIAGGFKIVSLREAALEHHFPETFAALARQQWRYGRGAFQLRGRSPRARRPRVRGVGYYWRMLAGAPREYGWRGVGVGMLSGVSQLIVACGYLRERFFPGRNDSPARPFKESCAK